MNNKFIWDEFKDDEHKKDRTVTKKQKEELYRQTYTKKVRVNKPPEINPEIERRIQEQKKKPVKPPKKKKSKKDKMRRIILFIILIIMACILFFAPIVMVDNVSVSELNFVTKEQLLKDIEISEKSAVSPFQLFKISFAYKSENISGININYIRSSQTLNLNVKEMTPLCINEKGEMYYNYGGKVLKTNEPKMYAPQLQGFDEEHEKTLVDAMTNLDYNVIKEISTIIYTPSEISNESVVMEMKDGNYVKIMMSQIETKMPYYNQMSEIIDGAAGGRNGIIHLDRGDYYEPI